MEEEKDGEEEEEEEKKSDVRGRKRKVVEEEEYEIGTTTTGRMEPPGRRRRVLRESFENDEDDGEEEAEMASSLVRSSSSSRMDPPTPKVTKVERTLPVFKFGENETIDLSDETEEGRERQKRLLENYTSIVQLSAEKKITKKNAWSLDLIENIHSILACLKGNFPKAGSTLAASVDIYEKRVDSMHLDTFKVFEHVNRSSMADSKQQNHQKKPLSELDEGDSNEEVPKGSKFSAHSSVHSNNFIEKNLAKLDLAVDREYEIDPLFKKMSKAFDEGGARGMLLNLLGVHENCAVMFDTTSAIAFPQREVVVKIENEEETPNIDLSSFSESVIWPESPHPFCPSLHPLRSVFKEYDNNKKDGNDLPLGAREEDSSKNLSRCENDDNDNDNYFGGDGGGYDHDDDNNFTGEVTRSTSSSSSTTTERTEDGASKKHPSPSGLIPTSLSLKNLSSSSVNSNNANTIEQCLTSQPNGYTYFAPEKIGVVSASSKKGDTAVNGAPSPHWRRARTPKKLGFGNDDDDDDHDHDDYDRRGKSPRERSSSTNGQRSRSKKLLLDFGALSLGVKTRLVLASESANQMDEDEFVKEASPIDLHFDANRLRRLFLKPETLITPGQEIEPPLPEVIQTTLGASSSSSSSDAYDYDDDPGGGFGGSTYDDDDESFRPNGLTQSQILSQLSEPELDLVTPGRQIEKVTINYAKRAKKVDVKKLKSTIWGFIENPSSIEQNGASSSSSSSQALSFGETVKALAPKLQSNISVPLYFICALHLANEKGLQLVPQEDMKDFKIVQQPISQSATTRTTATSQESQTEEQQQEENEREPPRKQARKRNNTT